MAVRMFWDAFKGWVKVTQRDIRQNGVAGLQKQIRYAAAAVPARAFQSVGTIANYGDSVWDSEWDLLIVLDACRPDLVAAVEDDYEFLSTETRFSNASQSAEWLEKNFTSNAPPNTAYVTANPFSDAIDHGFEYVDEVWKYSWDEEIGTVPPREVTDAAIKISRENDYNRLVVHYMQPHYPFIPDPLTDGFNPNTNDSELGASLWQQMRRGEISPTNVWEPYKKNLEYVLEDVDLLLSNVNADKAIITADHANAMGEWFTFGHIKYAPVPAMKRVPWCETSAKDTKGYEPGSVEKHETDTNRQEQLEALGYR